MSGVRTVWPGDAGYPDRLGHLHRPPDRLYVLGRPLTAMPPAVAIVGARNATAYGREVARALGRDCAAIGFVVVSGMARGVDAAAHEGALEAGGWTVAVLASGPSRPYPPALAGLHRRIVRTGTIVSERPDGSEPHRIRFLERNRIIAGLASAVVMVQGVHERSGALSTVKHATEHGRAVLGVPGDIRSDLSSGPNELLRDGAAPCTRAEDIVVALKMDAGVAAAMRDDAARPSLGADADRVMDAIAAEPGRPETIAARTGLEPGAVLGALSRLEIAGCVARSAGGAYVRTR